MYLFNRDVLESTYFAHVWVHFEHVKVKIPYILLQPYDNEVSSVMLIRP